MVRLNLKITANIMKVSNFYKNLFYNFVENLLVLIVGLIVAVALLATVCSDGNKGIVDLL